MYSKSDWMQRKSRNPTDCSVMSQKPDGEGVGNLSRHLGPGVFTQTSLFLLSKVTYRGSYEEIYKINKKMVTYRSTYGEIKICSLSTEFNE